MPEDELVERILSIVNNLELIAVEDPSRAIDVCTSALAVWLPEALSPGAVKIVSDSAKAMWDPDLLAEWREQMSNPSRAFLRTLARATEGGSK